MVVYEPCHSYFRRCGVDDKLAFTNLMEYLEEFRDSSEETKKVGENIIERVKSGGKYLYH
jgi:hypothetical protein